VRAAEQSDPEQSLSVLSSPSCYPSSIDSI